VHYNIKNWFKENDAPLNLYLNLNHKSMAHIVYVLPDLSEGKGHNIEKHPTDETKYC
jgi:hypothetical protein